MEVKGSTTIEMYGVFPFLAFSVPGEPHRQQWSFPATVLYPPVFAAGGYYWSVRMYPAEMQHGVVIDRFSVSLQLMSTGAGRVRASHELSVLDSKAILPPRSLFATPPRYFVFDSDHNDLAKIYLQGQCLEYVYGGRLLFQCTVTIFPDQTTTLGAAIDVPPSDMLGHQLYEALETGEGADVTFSVEGELFPAHKVVLAMRSKVFKAELFGETRENGAAQAIVIDDMRASTFKALLRYIYTNASPAAITNNDDSQDEGDDEHDIENHGIRVWELLMAADRYDLQRLKLICERVLCKRLDVENVADMVALADQNHWDTLKDACIEFMTTGHRMGQVAATQGYLQLKSCHPHLLFEVLEKSSSFHKHVE